MEDTKYSDQGKKQTSTLNLSCSIFPKNQLLLFLAKSSEQPKST